MTAPTDNVIQSSANNSEKLQMASFLAKLTVLVQDGQEDDAMRLIYSHFHALRRAGCYGDCDAILDELDERQLAPVLLVAVLTITAPVKSKLAQRTNFYNRAKQAILGVRGPETTERMLVGLE